MKRRLQSIVTSYCSKFDGVNGKIEENKQFGTHRIFVVLTNDKGCRVSVTFTRALIWCNWFNLDWLVNEHLEWAIGQLISQSSVHDCEKQEVINKLLDGFEYIADMDGMAGEDYMDEWTEAASFTMCKDLANDMISQFERYKTLKEGM